MSKCDCNYTDFSNVHRREDDAMTSDKRSQFTSAWTSQSQSDTMKSSTSYSVKSPIINALIMKTTCAMNRGCLETRGNIYTDLGQNLRVVIPSTPAGGPLRWWRWKELKRKDEGMLANTCTFFLQGLQEEEAKQRGYSRFGLWWIKGNLKREEITSQYTGGLTKDATTLRSPGRRGYRVGVTASGRRRKSRF